MVDRTSAFLNMEPEKTRMKVDGDHKEIARLRRGQGGVYPNVLHIIKDALQSASEQFTAATRTAEAQAAEKEKEKEKEKEQPVTFDQNEDQDEDMESDGEYDDSNLICDICYDEFSKTQTHLHCYICGDGNFNICQSCRELEESCPGGHKMLERQLGEPDASDWEAGDEDYNNYLDCYACEKEFLKDQIHFHCIICNDGSYDICLSCRKMGRICPGRHKLVKRQLPLNVLTPPTTNKESARSPSPSFWPIKSESPNGNSENNNNNDNNNEKQSKGTRTPPKDSDSPPGLEFDLSDMLGTLDINSSRPKKAKEIEYCDITGCNCDRPKKPKDPEPPKKDIEYCEIPGCNCSRPKKPKEPESPKKEIEYCEIPDCKCSLPKRPKITLSSTTTSTITTSKENNKDKSGWRDDCVTCRVCGSSFDGRNALFNHLEMYHMD